MLARLRWTLPSLLLLPKECSLRSHCEGLGQCLQWQ